MELEVSDEEVEHSEEEKMEEGDEITSLREEGILHSDMDKMVQSLENKLFYKNQKRKTKWGPTLRAPRPRRYANDGRTMMEKAQRLKEIKNLEKGKKNQKPPLLLKAMINYLKCPMM
jgi:hypothetical protein